MSKIFCIIDINEGRLTNLTVLNKFLTQLEQKDGKYLLEANGHNKRSNPQNRYYWGICVPMVQTGIKEMGTEITKEETHEFLKAKFNYSELVNEQTGQVEMIPRSTTILNKEQFSEFIEKIQQFAAEFLSIEIPGPGTQTRIFKDGTALSY